MTRLTNNLGITFAHIKEIAGYPGYFASKDGVIYSTRKGALSELKPRIRNGYLRVNVRSGSGRKTSVTKPIHQLVLLAFTGEMPRHCNLTRHLNGDPFDNRLDNIRWGTHKENSADSLIHGTAACLKFGEKAPATKLSDEDVLNIEKMVLDGEKKLRVARKFNISAAHVRDIVNHRTRKYLWA
ncbi:HNH endonuclease [Proteus vulgaris]|uniref:HNH endonuclease n=1 Tax=Proteus vulgaris TaxID=585 RepID=UPI0025412C1E|nr:HNH endonuclease [Proteus vulgaris]WIF71381.1 HNH endonuclease [Proteus vulgaris]